MPLIDLGEYALDGPMQVPCARAEGMRRNGTDEREADARKKDAGPKGPASQTGRLHVWETWDHWDPEFRTRSVETGRVENLKERYALSWGM
jgi:hypothetical protein